MPLTRPKIWDLDTNVEYFMDPITVLHQGSTQANVDVGFLFNRANGLVSNVAVYWSESANTFVTAFTNNSGVTNSNIVATGYANLTIGSLLSINGNIYLNGTAGTPGQYISSTASGTAWASSSFNGGVISNTLFPSGNLTLNLGTTSAFWANTYTGNVILSNNILWANGTVFSSGTGSGSVGYSPSANVAIYANVTPYTTNQTFYPVFSNITTAGNSVAGVNSSLSYNPSTGALTATSFSGTLSAVNVAGTTATANAVIYTGITNTASGTYYPVLSSQNTTGNTQAAVNSSLSYNAATGNVSATAFVGSGQYLTGITVAGTVATANVALYEQVQNYTTGTFYPTFSNTSITAGNTVIGVNSSLSYNATTGTLSATNLSGTLQTAAQTNITSVGTLTSLAVGAVTSSGTIIASTVTAATIGNSGAVLTGSTGTFTSWANVTGTANSTSTSTGALVVAGGAGIAGNLYVGGNISASNFLGNIFFGPTPTATYYTQAPLNLTNSLAGGIKTQLNLINTGGGAGAGAGIDFYTYTSVAGSTYPEARIAVVDDGNYSNYITFQTKIPGNTGANALAERLKIDSAGNLVIPTTTTSTSTTTGALVVAGGVGVAGALYTGSVVSATITATTVNAATIGNAGASLVGTLSAVNVAGTVATANATVYTGIINTASGTYYPVLSSQNTTGNVQAAASSSLSYNAATGALTATSFSGTVTATSVAGTVATANAAVYTGVTNTASGTYYPVLSSQNTTGNAQSAVNSSLSYNAATGALSATTFVGTISATNISGTNATANVALYEQITNLTNNQTYYLPFANVVSGNSTLGAVTAVNINPSTGNVSATAFVGSGQYLTGVTATVAGTVATANVALYASATPYTTTANFYPVFSNTVTAGNTTSGVATNMVFNPGTGNLYVNNIVGSGQYITGITATVSGTVATANVALYESVTAYTTNQTFYPVFSNISTTGNTTSGVSNNLSFNPGTGNLTIGGNVIQNNKTYFNFSGDEQVISQDTSIMRTGSWSVTASGSLYTLAGEPVMWYWIHNCAIDPATGNFLARDDNGPVTVWALTESMLIKTWISPPDQILSVPSSWTLTGNQDTNNGLFTTGGMSGNSLKLTQVTTPATAVGTGSTTGGSLAAGNYYVRVVGLDVNGQATLPSPESTVVTTTGSTGSINYVIPATIGVNTYRIYVTQTSGTYTSGYFTFNPDYLTNYFTLTTLTGTTAGTLPSINNTGGVNITGNLTVLNTGGTSNSISGNVGINTTVPDSGLTILRTPQTVVYPVTGVNSALGTDLHITGADGATPTRITQDTFGTGGYVAFTGRTGRGTAASPTQTLSGDTLTQFTARGFSGGSLGFGTASTGRVDIVAAENFTDTSRATNVVIFTTAVGSVTPTATATFSSASGLAVTGNTAISGNLTTNGGLLVPVLGLSIVSAQGWNLA